jgi:lysophospholipase L1-like esterase
MKDLSKLRFLALKLCLSFTIFALGMELASHLYFYRLMPPAERNNILFALHGVTRDTPQRLLPSIRPYLWSNYEPMPGTRNANSYGWRYGGGPKTNQIRILCIGGSTTWSQGVSDPTNSYPAQMERYLRQRGLSVDAVNGGCPYYTTAEMIGALAFRGIYTEPDIVLIHEGGNDAFPLMSPQEYKPDYTHWRTAENSAVLSSELELFRFLWHIPSYAVRVFAWKLLHPDPFQRQTLGTQLDSAQACLLATNDISHRVNSGYRENLKSLVALCRGHNAIPVFITWRLASHRLDSLVPELKKDPALERRVRNRIQLAVDQNNNIMLEVGRSLNVPVIPFHMWSPSSADMWVDQCHLNDQGCQEKAAYIGDWLIHSGVLANPLSKPESVF